MDSQALTTIQARGNGSAPPPGGATFASFTLFASLAALLAFVYLVGEWLGLGGFGFPTDAAWVRAVFARSVSAGHGLCFTSATPVGGVAAPTWIAALGLSALPTGDYVITAKVLGVLAVILSAVLAWKITLRLLGDWRFAFLAGLLVITSPLLSEQALSGTEGAFAGLLVLALIYWWGRGWEGRRGVRVGGAFALGLAALTRPELILLFPLALIDRWAVAGLHGRPGERVAGALSRSLPEVLGAVLVIAPYLAYNLYAGGPLWQQPDLVLRAEPAFSWARGIVLALWGSNPVLLIAAAIGLFVVCLAPARARAEDPTFLPALVPVALLLFPALLWHYAGSTNATYTATALVPLVSVLGVAGLYLLWRLAHLPAARAGTPNARTLFVVLFVVLCTLTVAAVFAIMAPRHRTAWNRHEEDVKQEYGLQVSLGKRAAQILTADASIAAREVGAIGFFSNRRMVDLGGSISMEGIRALRRTGSPDSDLLAYLRETKPSHLAIRPDDFPDLSRRADLFQPLVTCVYNDKSSGGTVNLILYETPWPPPSLRALGRERE